MSDLQISTQHRGGRIGILSAWASRLGGGVFEAVVAHCELTRIAGFEPVVIALSDEYTTADRARFGKTELIALPVVGPRILGYAPNMVRTLLEARLDLLHLHGIWMYPSAGASRWAKLTGRPYVISPHGMMDPWIVSRGKLKKNIAKLAYERTSWRRATAFHALTEAEARDINAVTGRDKIATIPNAIREVIAGGARETTPRERTVLYIGRIHPKKNIDGLIMGWALARDMLGAGCARLKIAGWGDDDHVSLLRAQIEAAGGDDIEFLGPVYGQEKASLIAAASFLALASHSEGLPVAILEGWATGTPSIMSEHCHLPEGFESGAALECSTEPSSIATALHTAFALDEVSYRAMRQAALDLVRDNFTPDVISNRWSTLYGSLI